MLENQDSVALGRLVDDVRAWSTDGAFAANFAEFAGRRDIRALARHLTFDHAAILVFPDCEADVSDLLVGLGLKVSTPVASVVVRRRLAARYGVGVGALTVSIIRGVVADGPAAGTGVEVFAVPRQVADAAAPRMVGDERDAHHESHLAFVVANPESGGLESVRNTFRDRLAMHPDGGGYNPFDDADSGGRSVLYFAAPASDGERPCRFELTCAGHHPQAIAAHHRSGQVDDDNAARLLAVLTGQWAARSVYVAARLGIADVLAEGPRSAPEVADRVACDPAATARLLRYLASLGVVDAEDPDRYALTPMGRLLCSANQFHDLVRLYGEEFTDAWGDLLPAVRTGRSAFGHRFGVEHFEYFERHPETARTFDRAMGAVTDLVAGAVSKRHDFPPDSSVVDVGGGNGALLHAVLRANPTLTGVLFDRDHVAGNAPDGTGRLRAVAGDFFAEVPSGGDSYLLSRVLHDWDDDDCLRILTTVRAACGPDATLLVLERLLPDRAGVTDATLALPWDMHMLAVTGGRERSRHEYAQLLAAAGFRLGGASPLPVDMNVLVAHPV